MSKYRTGIENAENGDRWGLGMRTGWRQWQGHEGPQGPLSASSRITCKGFCSVKPKGIWQSVRLLSCDQSPSAPLWWLSVLVSGAPTKRYFIHLQTLIYFSPFLPTKEHSVHTVLHCVVVSFFHSNQFWKPFYTITLVQK